MPAKLIISGAPASGKGTQCEFIKKEYGVIHLSTGDILREAIKAETPVGLRAKEFVENGKLVPDQIICDMVLARVQQSDCAQHGWLLDGFPRTGVQAEALAKAGVTCDAFVQMDVPDELLLERVTGRRLDPETGKIYHLKFSPPESEEISARLLHRADDTEEKFGGGLKAYHENLGSILAMFTDKVVSIKIASGAQSPDSIFAEIKLALSKKIASPIIQQVETATLSVSTTLTETIVQPDVMILLTTAIVTEANLSPFPTLTTTAATTELSADTNPEPVTVIAANDLSKVAPLATAVAAVSEVNNTNEGLALTPTAESSKILSPTDADTNNTTESTAAHSTEPAKLISKGDAILAPCPGPVSQEQTAPVRTRSASDSEAVQPLSGLPVGSAIEAVRKLSVQPTMSVA